ICDSYVCKNKNMYFIYQLSKKAFFELTKHLAIELGPKIRVNSISPSSINGFTDNIDQELLRKRKQNIPLSDFPDIDDITGAISFFINNKNITGQNIFTDGGENLI